MAVNPMDAMMGGIGEFQREIEKGIETAQASAEVMKVLKPELQARILRPDHHIKTGRIVRRMQAAGYTEVNINHVVQALVANRDEEMQGAFDLLSGGDGSIDSNELKVLVPLIGENMTDEQVRCLFFQADRDESGLIDFEEFCQMMYSLTPKAAKGGLKERQVALTHAQEAVAAAEKSLDGAALALAYAQLLDAEESVQEMRDQQNPDPVTPKGLMEKAGPALVEGFENMGAGMTSFVLLDPLVQARILHPADHQRAGRVIQRMESFPKKAFSRKDINDVITSLAARRDAEMTPAFHLWAGEDGKIDAGEFQEVVPLLGEDVTEEEIMCMFSEADKDGNGTIDLPEFVAMMKLIQMKGDSSARHKLLGRARAQAFLNKQ